MYSIRIIGLISVLAGGVLNQAQELKTVTTTPLHQHGAKPMSLEIILPSTPLLVKEDRSVH